MRKDIYDFTYQDQRYFYEPESGGVYQYNPLLRDIFSLGPGFSSDQIVHELSSKHPEEKIKDLLKNLYEKKLLPVKTAGSTAHGADGVEEMYIQVSHRCNLDCTYCYAQGGRFGGPGEMMTEATARNAVDFLFRESGTHQTCIINFDGGEPFLNFPLVESTTAYAKEKARQSEKRVRFNISTNGTLFTKENVEFLTQNRFGIGISIDGDQSTHDRARKFKNGRGSYRTLSERLSDTDLFKHRKPTHARATITKESLLCSRTVSHLYSMGFRVIYLEPAAGKDETWVIDREDLEIIKEEFGKVAGFYKEELLKGHFIILRNFFQPLEKIHLKSKSGYRCAAGCRTLAAAPDGSLYPCYKFVGVKNHIMGNVNNGAQNIDISTRFMENHVNGKSTCKDCWARYICGGGCPYLAEISNNNISIKDGLDCEFTRHLITLSLEIYVDISQKNKDTWKRFFG